MYIDIILWSFSFRTNLILFWERKKVLLFSHVTQWSLDVAFRMQRVGKWGGVGGRGCRARFTGIKIENSRFTEIKTDFSRITHHSACPLIFHPYSITGLTCWPFRMIIACTLNNCFSRSNTKFTLIHKCMLLPSHQDGVENRDKACSRFASPICDYLFF